MEQGRIQIIFDADCGICTKSMELIYRYDRKKIFSGIPNSPEIAKIHPELNYEKCLEKMHIIDGVQIFSGGIAVILILWRLPFLFKLIAFLMCLPPQIFFVNFFYKLFAKNRYIFGRVTGNSCKIHNKNK